MTLQDILTSSEQSNIDLSQAVVFANNNVVYDYKEKKNNIILISDDESFGAENITVTELLKYVEECGLEYETTYLVDENTGEFFMNHSWESDNLLLSY